MAAITPEMKVGEIVRNWPETMSVFRELQPELALRRSPFTHLCRREAWIRSGNDPGEVERVRGRGWWFPTRKVSWFESRYEPPPTPCEERRGPKRRPQRDGMEWGNRHDGNHQTHQRRRHRQSLPHGAAFIPSVAYPLVGATGFIEVTALAWWGVELWHTMNLSRTHRAKLLSRPAAGGRTVTCAPQRALGAAVGRNPNELFRAL